jgi:hypothetical protein
MTVWGRMQMDRCQSEKHGELNWDPETRQSAQVCTRSTCGKVIKPLVVPLCEILPACCMQPYTLKKKRYYEDETASSRVNKDKHHHILSTRHRQQVFLHACRQHSAARQASSYASLNYCTSRTDAQAQRFAVARSIAVDCATVWLTDE